MLLAASQVWATEKQRASVRQNHQAGSVPLSWTQSLFEVIDMRSFSNLWFWIALAVVWSQASHFPLGVPFDLMQRASREGGDVERDVEDLVRVNIGRILYIGRMAGLWLLGFVSFVLTGLGLMAFVYDVEFAQALFLIGLPMSVVGAMTLSVARLIEDEKPQGADLLKRLQRHRTYIRLIGMASIFVTAMYGMYQNLASMPGF